MPSDTQAKLDELGVRALDTLTVAGEQGVETVKSLVEFIKAQAPELVEEIIFLGRAETTVNMGTCLFLISFGWIWFCSVRKDVDKEKWPEWCGEKGDRVPIRIFCYIFSFFMCVVPSIVWLTYSVDWIKPWIAPKLFLLEYLTELVK